MSHKMNKYLLDTNIVIWWLTNQTHLIPKRILKVIKDRNSMITVSSVSAWEISIKKSLKKLEAPDNLKEMMSLKGFWELNITFDHARKVKDLPLIHRDPFDRMLIAQARVEDLTILTKDKIFAKYDVDVII